jgi:uncharacterized YceG family protein
MSGEDSRSRQRTAEDREAARRERAERRRKREGRAADPSAAPEAEPPIWTDPPAEPDTEAPSWVEPDAEAPSWVEPDAEPVAEPPPATELPPADEPLAVDELPAVHDSQAGGELPARAELAADGDQTAGSDAEAADLGGAASRKPLLHFPRNAGKAASEDDDLSWTPALAGTPRSSRNAGEARRRARAPHLGGGGSDDGRHRLWPRIVAVLGLLALALIAWLLVSVFQPFSGEGHGRVVVSIPKGASASRVGGILAKDGVIESSFFFDIRTFLGGDRGDLHAGTYTLKRGMSYSSAIAALSKANNARPAVVKVVIPEGQTRVQIAQTARRDGLKGSYLTASKRAPNFPPSHYGAPAGTPNLEGFLFPATYELDKGAPVSELVQEQLVAFSERFGETAIHRAKALKLTPYQLLIVASMIEREAELPHDRPLVAAVIYNRLRLGMALGIDATIRFALNDYDKPLTEAQLHIDSPYNTRTHKGLPPTPISNPGTETIEAAAHPANVKYLYYVAGADGCGDLVFANTSSEFERESAEYNEALAKNGGNVPACKHK